VNENLNCTQLALENKRLREELRRVTQSNNELLAHKQQLDAIMDNAPIEVNLKDREGRYIRVSKVFETSFGVKNENLVGLFPATVHGPEMAAAAREHDLSVLNLGKVERRELISDSNTKGQRITLSTTKFPIFNSDGEISGLGTIDIDITQRILDIEQLLKSNDLFRQTEQFSKVGHWEWDELASRYITCSEEYARILGVPFEQLIESINSIEKFYGSIYEEDYERYKQVYEEAVENKQGWDIEYRSYDKAGDLLHLHEIGETVLDDHGVLIKTVGIIQDITKMKLVQDDLKQSQALFQQAEAIGNLGYWCWDRKEDKLSTCSVQYANIYDMTVAEAVGYFISTEATMALIHPDDKANFKQAAYDFNQKNKEFDVEFRVTTHSGNVRYLHLLSKFGLDNDRAPSLSFGVVQDITKRKQTEQDLVDGKRRMDEIIWATNVGTWEWNTQTGEAEFNDRWADIVGYTLEELSPITTDVWRKLCHPNDLKGSDELLKRHISGELEYYDSKFRMRHKNDDWIWVHGSGKVVEWTKDHKPLRISGIHLDITKKKRAEAELQQSQDLFKQAESMGNMGHFHWDLENDKLISCSEQFARIYGMTVRETLDRFVSVEALIDLIHPDDKELFRQTTKVDNETHKRKYISYKVIILGKTCHLHVRREVTVDENGLPSQVFGIVQDITVEKNKENALLQSIETVKEAQSELKFQNHVLDERTKELFITNKELAFQNQEKSKRADELILVNEEKDLIRLEADKTKSEFISTVSHELRTPLTSIKGALGLMKAGVFDKNPEKIPPILNIAYKNAERLNHLIDDILDIESLNLGKMRFHMAMTDLSAVVKEATSSNETYGSPYGVTFVCSGIEKPLFVNGDYHRLIQVIANLLSNAAKFSPPNGQVDVSLARHEGSLRISIRNDGEHIPESARDTLFDIFTQVDSSDVRQKGGSGLGLSIAKMIIKAHDGYIDFISEVDSGTTFYVALPELELSEVIQ